MTAQMHLFQPVLPSTLQKGLQQVRTRYQEALCAAGTGDFSRAEEMAAISHRVGHLLATEAKKSVEERGGLGMLEISLAVDRLFPELRGWNRHEAERKEWERLRSLQAPAGLPDPVPTRRRRAS